MVNGHKLTSAHPMVSPANSGLLTIFDTGEYSSPQSNPCRKTNPDNPPHHIQEAAATTSTGERRASAVEILSVRPRYSGSLHVDEYVTPTRLILGGPADR